MKILTCLVGLLLPLQAVVIREPGDIVGDSVTKTQDRFTGNSPGSSVNGSFAYSAYNFSGVGWDANSVGKSVTLISDRHFLAAAHFIPTNSINFLKSDNTILNRSVATYTTIANPAGSIGFTANSDLLLGTLSAPIAASTGITPFKILDPSVTAVGQNFLIYGQRGRVGESYVLESGSIGVGSISGLAYASFYPIASGGNNDAYFTSGDSGGPSFVISSANELILAGVHWAVGTTNDGLFKVNIDTNVSSYFNRLEAETGAGVLQTSSAIQAASPPPFTVPEPSSALFIFISASMVCLRRCK